MIDAEDLPDGWAVTTLGESCEIVRGITFPASEKKGVGTPSAVACLRTSNVQDLLELDDILYVPEQYVKRDDQWLRRGDTVISMANSYELVGKVAFADDFPIRTSFGGFLSVIRGRCYDSRFLFFLLRSSQTQESIRRTASRTVNIANISLKGLNDVELPLPPLAEQRRIVAKVEELTARSRAARAALAEVPTLLEQFRQSVLASAFRGDLTADWRANNSTAEPASVLLDRIRAERRKQFETKYPKKKYAEPEPVDDSDLPELPEGWEYARADEIVATGTVITYGIVLPGDPIDGGVPYVRGQDIEDGRILVEQLARTTPEIAARHDRSSLQQGDVLLCIIRHLKVAIVPAGIDGANLTQGTVRLRPSEVILGPYLAGYLAGPTAQAWMKERYFGMAMPRINVEDARAIPIPIAPIEEQREIIRQIDASERRRATALTEVTQALDESGGLDQSILAKAFRGELVPQDPADEPASDLLERIRQQQDSGTNGTASARKRRRTTST